MVIGASTANFYPMLTEDALAALLKLGFRDVEIFLNSQSEATIAFAKTLRRMAREAGATIWAAHSYFSVWEPFLLFTGYQRRFQDGLQVFEQLFAAAAEMGARFVVLHGDRTGSVLSTEQYCERYEQLYDLGRQYEVTLVQENVVHYRASSPAFIRDMRRLLGDKARFVLDLKQCRRSGVEIGEMQAAMGEGLVHVHISDGDLQRDCLIPGKGTTPFAPVFDQLKQAGFEGAVILELYRKNFDQPQELVEGKRFLEQFL